MKVLMFGWEFPPKIYGGLAVASYGITKGLSLQGDMETTFCLPKPCGDEGECPLAFLRYLCPVGSDGERGRQMAFHVSDARGSRFLPSHEGIERGRRYHGSL